MTPSVPASTVRGKRETETPELLGKYLDHVGRSELLTHEEEIGLSKRVGRRPACQTEAHRQEFASRGQRRKKVSWVWAAVEDMIQEGDIGLMRGP